MGCLYNREAGERGEGNVPTKEETGVMAAHQGMLATSPARVSEESHLPPKSSGAARLCQHFVFCQMILKFGGLASGTAKE